MEKDIAPDESGTYHLARHLLPGDDPSLVLREVARLARDAGGGTIELPPGEYSLPDPTVLGDVDLRGGLGRTVVVFDEPLHEPSSEPSSEPLSDPLSEPLHEPPGPESGPADAGNHLPLARSSM